MFSELEQKAIQEKLGQLKSVIEGKLTLHGLADIITERRVNWIRAHLGKMLKKYEGLSPEEQAYHIVFLEHMRINPKHSNVVRVSPGRIRIESYNFCPYLESCCHLNLDTRFVCRAIGEQPFQRMIEIINPNLRFSRNYDNIRPYNCDFCEEYIELVLPSNPLNLTE